MFDFKMGIFSCRKKSLTVFDVRFFMKRAVLNRVVHAIYESKGNAAFQYPFESSVTNTVVENEEYKKSLKEGGTRCVGRHILSLCGVKQLHNCRHGYIRWGF
jgi:hypothetical protein